MAAFIQDGGTNGGTYAKYFSAFLTVWENSFDISKNTSNVGYRLQLRSGSQGRFSGLRANFSVTINGVTVNNGSGTYNSQSYNTYQTICEGTTTVVHNEDGSKTIGCSCSLDFQTHTYSPGDFNPSGNLVLSTIPRASGVGASSAYIEENTIIKINKASNNFTHTLLYSFNQLSGKIVEKTSESTYSWKIPNEFYSQIPSNKSGIAKITCITYNNNQELGQSSCEITVNTNETKCKPNLNVNIIDANSKTTGLTGNNKKMVKYFSTAQITYSATAKNSATIKSVTVNGTTMNKSPFLIQKVETNNFNITVTDSRGFTTTITPSDLSLVNYIPLTINATVKRTQPTTGEVSIDYTGNYFNSSFGKVQNTLKMKWSYRVKGNTTWTNGGNITPNISENTYSNKTSLGKIFDYTKAYEFTFEISDQLTILQTTYSVSKGIPIFCWGKDFINFFEKILIKGIDINEKFDGKVLYNNANGIASGTATINDNISNYKKILVEVKGESIFTTVMFLEPDGKMLNCVVDSERGTGWYVPTTDRKSVV